jgi:hypothetical protein
VPDPNFKSSGPSTRRASSGCRASPARAARSTPTASTCAPWPSRPTSPTPPTAGASS